MPPARFYNFQPPTLARRVADSEIEWDIERVGRGERETERERGERERLLLRWADALVNY